MGQVGLGQGGLLNGWDRWDWDRGFFRLGGTGWDRDRGVFRLGGPEGTGTFFLVCYAATQLATPLQQRRIQVVRSNKVARKRLTESNGTPAMDVGCEETHKRKYTQTKNRTKHTTTIGI